MKNKLAIYIIVFIAMVLIQGFFLNAMQLSTYLYPMVYIMVLLILPYDTNIFIALGVAFFLGIIIDGLSDTFGLHTSSALLVAFIRPSILNLIKPRDGYELNLDFTFQDMGYRWFISYALIMIAIHHLWFFSLDLFRFNLIGMILLKTIISSISTLFFIFIFQMIFFKPSR